MMEKVISRQEALDRGLKYYFTGKLCKHGHVSERLVVDMTCHRCKIKINKKWKNNNKDHCKEYTKQYYRSNKEHCNMTSKRWREEHHDHCKDQDRQYRINNNDYFKNWREENKKRRLLQDKKYREENKEVIKLKNKKYCEENKEQVLLRQKVFRTNNPEKICAAANKRRADKISSTPKWCNLEEIENLYKKAKELTLTTNINHVVDHIVPLRSKLVCGLHVHTNLRVITAQENAKKSNKLIEELL